MNEQRADAPPFWDCPDCGRELDWNEETLTWCDECGAEWRYGEDESDELNDPTHWMPLPEPPEVK